jgi:hypothetical protein
VPPLQARQADAAAAWVLALGVSRRFVERNGASGLARACRSTRCRPTTRHYIPCSV